MRAHRPLSLLVPAGLLAAALAGCTATKDRVPVLDEATRTPVAGASSTLVRHDRGIASRFRTRALPGHAYSLWYVVFNAPERCSDGICGQDDIFLDPRDPAAGFNAPQIRSTRASSVWARDGAVADRRGRLRLRGRLRVGAPPRGARQVVVGRAEDGALAPVGLVTGIEDPHGAVVIAVLQDHGKAHDDRDLRKQQLTTFSGACNPACAEVQLAPHVP